MSSLRPGSGGRRPASSRPDAGSRTAARAAARRTAGRSSLPPSTGRSALTTRATVLGLVLVALVLSAAVPLREFLAQRGDIRQAEAAQTDARARIAALEARKRQLEDPAQVRQLARERFGYVLPGETLYTVLRPQAPAEQPVKAGQVPATRPEEPWYQQVWGSVGAADRAPAK
ncbi:MAG: hypothetical protein JWM64_1974 [Frankiales bacterium]|nr:hypothetical protein [Frankiales bacterium]